MCVCMRPMVRGAVGDCHDYSGVIVLVHDCDCSTVCLTVCVNVVAAAAEPETKNTVFSNNYTYL